MKYAIPYYRVSTKGQGRSHLGLDAQQLAVWAYCTANGYTVLQEIEEVKSTRKQRPRLHEALALCRLHKATLIVARLDRLGRDVEQIVSIVNSKVDIIITDNPHVNRFTLHILAAVAEENRRVGSENTKASLQAAKNKGTILGKHGKVLAEKNKRDADEFAMKLQPTLNVLASQGFTTVRAIKHELNKRGVPTFTPGAQWHVASVYNLLVRLNKSLPTNPIVSI